MATLAAMRRLLLGGLVAATLAVAAPAHAGGPSMVVGAAEDAVKQDNVAGAKAKLDLLKLAGFRAVRITSTWAPALRAPVASEQQRLDSLASAAQMDGIVVYVQVMNFGSKTTPLTTQQQNDFAAYAATIVRKDPSFQNVIVGNEPNNNRFWLPQFGLDGSDVAAASYEALLATTYDALKAVSPDV